MDSQETVQGACQCGQLRISVPRSALPKFSGLCHCVNCKAASGSLYTVNLPIPTKDIVLEGDAKIYSAIAESGNTADRHFCGVCGCTVMSRAKEHPETTYVKAGSFAKSGIALPPPVHEQFWRRAEVWEKPYEGANIVD